LIRGGLRSAGQAPATGAWPALEEFSAGGMNDGLFTLQMSGVMKKDMSYLHAEAGRNTPWAH